MFKYPISRFPNYQFALKLLSVAAFIQATGESLALGGSVLLITGACLAWAIDNNLTRRVSGGDPLQIAALKGIAAGSINVLLAVVQQAPWPSSAAILGAGVVGFLGYGTSLVGKWDASTGLYYYRARYYDAVLGRFLSPDPLPAKLTPLAAAPRLDLEGQLVTHVAAKGTAALGHSRTPTPGRGDGRVSHPAALATALNTSMSRLFVSAVILNSTGSRPAAAASSSTNASFAKTS